jgi:uncharacterized protein YjiS (DUF1127 family)
MLFADLFVAVKRALAERRRQREEQAELLALDEHTLADIGLRRAQIAGIIYGEAEQPPAHRPAGRAMRTQHRPV